MQTMKTVKNMNTLKAMAKRGFILLHSQTGTKVKSLYTNRVFTCYYVNDGEPYFEYKGSKYSVRYFSGSFYPYVIKINSL